MIFEDGRLGNPSARPTTSPAALMVSVFAWELG